MENKRIFPAEETAYERAWSCKEHVSRAWGVICCDVGSGFIGQSVKRGGQKGGLVLQTEEKVTQTFSVV